MFVQMRYRTRPCKRLWSKVLPTLRFALAILGKIIPCSAILLQQGRIDFECQLHKLWTWNQLNSWGLSQNPIPRQSESPQRWDLNTCIEDRCRYISLAMEDHHHRTLNRGRQYRQIVYPNRKISWESQGLNFRKTHTKAGNKRKGSQLN